MILEVEYTVEVTKRGYVTVDEQEFELWLNEDADPGDEHDMAQATDRDIVHFMESGRTSWWDEHDLEPEYEVDESMGLDPPKIIRRNVHFTAHDEPEQVELPATVAEVPQPSLFLGGGPSLPPEWRDS